MSESVRLRQILVNVVSNAIKFTEHGSVEVVIGFELGLEVGAEQKSKMTFAVKDTGRGISTEQAERLFSPFVQADPSTTRVYGGTGLGLVLSKRLAKALGGDVVLSESVPGVGSTFVVSIDPGTPPQIEANSLFGSAIDTDPLAIERLGQRKILLVDDSLDNQEIVSHFLKQIGVVVETAKSGKEGIQKAITGEFALVLMDIQMPGMDGFEATQELRRMGFSRPIIALTAHAMKQDRYRCLENGFNDHVTKPIDRKALIHAISQFA